MLERWYTPLACEHLWILEEKLKTLLGRGISGLICLACAVSGWMDVFCCQIVLTLQSSISTLIWWSLYDFTACHSPNLHNVKGLLRLWGLILTFWVVACGPRRCTLATVVVAGTASYTWFLCSAAHWSASLLETHGWWDLNWHQTLLVFHALFYHVIKFKLFILPLKKLVVLNNLLFQCLLLYSVASHWFFSCKY